MDYQRIYNQFLADRRTNPPGTDEYAELHHILPRCMGGGDEPENLIPLRPEDHFFAHLLLAKVHRSRELWAACVMMAAMYNANGKSNQLFRSRRLYGIVMRNWSDGNRGETHFRADLINHAFYHYDGRTFTGTRIAFAEMSGIPAANINNVVTGRAVEAFGWSLTPVDPEERKRRRSAKSSAAGKSLRGFVRDWTVYHFYNEALGLSVFATQTGMRNLGYLHNRSISILVNGGAYVKDGWCLGGNADFAYGHALRKGDVNNRFNPKAFDFTNDLTGEVVSDTINAMGHRYNCGDSRPFGELARGCRNGFKGWRLSESAPARVLGRIYCFKHPEHGAVECTMADLARRFGLHVSQVGRVVAGKNRHVKGWTLG